MTRKYQKKVGKILANVSPKEVDAELKNGAKTRNIETPSKNADEIIEAAKNYLSDNLGAPPENLTELSSRVPIDIMRDLLMLIYIRGAEIERLRKGVV